MGFGAVNLDKDPELILDSVSKSGLPAIVIIGGGAVNQLEFDISQEEIKDFAVILHETIRNMNK